MVTLSNTTVHTSFSYEANGVVITGTAIVDKDNKVTNIDGGNISKNSKNVCRDFRAYEENGTLKYTFNKVDIDNFADVIPMLQALPASIVADLSGKTE